VTRPSVCFHFGLPKPRVENAAERLHHRACRFRFRLNEVNVFGIPGGRLQVKLVQRRSTTEGESLMERGMREYLDQRAADDEVLLDLEVLNPRRFRPPFGDVVARDHRSGSTSALM